MHESGRGKITKWAGLAAAVLLLATGCKSSSDTAKPTGTSGASGSSAAPVTNDPRAPGVTDDTIKIGITYVDFSSLGDAGITLNHGDIEGAYNAIIDDINSKGGINGRKLEAVFAPISPIGTAAADAACTKLTQDDKVFVVVGFVSQDNALCYVDTNETPVVGGDMTAERLGKAKVAWYSTSPSDDTESDVIRKLGESGKLAGKVAVVGMTADQAAYNARVKPLLDELKVNVVDTAFLEDTGTDVNLGYSNAQTTAEKFKADGAEQVLGIGPNVAQGFITGLTRTDFRPELRFSSLGAPRAYAQGQGNDLSAMPGALTGGGYDFNQFSSLGDPTKECIGIQEAAGLPIVPLTEVPKGEPRQIAGSFDACQQLYLLKAVMEKAGKDLNFGTFKDAGDSLGSITLPFSPDPWNFGPTPHSDGDQPVYLYEFDEAGKTFKMVQ